MAKQLLKEKIENIAKSLNITKKDVQNIIDEYLWYRQRELLEGKIVQIVGIVDIVPEPLSTTTTSTLAFVSRELAKKLVLPYNTVLFVLKYYLDVQYEQITMGNTVIFRGLVKINPIVVDDRISSIHSSISSRMTELARTNHKTESIRVHTSKALKSSLYGVKVKASKPSSLEELYAE